MTIGPAPMIRMEWMSVRLGMGLWRVGHAPDIKKGRAHARPCLRRVPCGEASRAGFLDRIRAQSNWLWRARARARRYARRARNVIRAGLCPILASARRAAKPTAASLAIIAGSL